MGVTAPQLHAPRVPQPSPTLFAQREFSALTSPGGVSGTSWQTHLMAKPLPVLPPGSLLLEERDERTALRGPVLEGKLRSAGQSGNQKEPAQRPPFGAQC